MTGGLVSAEDGVPQSRAGVGCEQAGRCCLSYYLVGGSVLQVEGHFLMAGIRAYNPYGPISLRPHPCRHFYPRDPDAILPYAQGGGLG